jgi:Cft2 family RNA processing exonuclease
VEKIENYTRNEWRRLKTTLEASGEDHIGIKFTAFRAGHVLGAAMFLIEIDGVRILYTGGNLQSYWTSRT